MKRWCELITEDHREELSSRISGAGLLECRPRENQERGGSGQTLLGLETGEAKYALIEFIRENWVRLVNLVPQ